MIGQHIPSYFLGSSDEKFRDEYLILLIIRLPNCADRNNSSVSFQVMPVREGSLFPKRYPYLVKHNGETDERGHVKFGVFDEHSESELRTMNRCLIRRECEKNISCYYVFDDYIAFHRALSDETTMGYHHFHEIILGKSPQKIYFDLDIKELSEGSDYDRIAQDFLDHVVDAIIAEMKASYGIDFQPKDLVVCTSHGEKKRSFHLIVYQYAVVNCEENKIFCRKVIDRVPNQFHRFIDTNPYRPNSSLRTLHSTKQGQTRYKTFQSSWMYRGSIVTFDVPEEDATPVQYLAYTLISAVTDSRMLPALHPVEPDREADYEVIPEIEAIFEEAWLKLPAGVYELGKKEGSSPKNDTGYLDKYPYRIVGLPLRRRKVGESMYCPYCKRDHTSQGAQLTRHKDGAITIRCWAEKNKLFTLVPAKHTDAIVRPDYTADTIKALWIPRRYQPGHVYNAPDLVFNWHGKKDLCLKANCGIGKSVALREHIRTCDPGARIIVISFRRSLASDQYKDLEQYHFQKYDHIPDNAIEAQRIIVQIDSIHRTRNMYDLVVLDEIEYLFGHLISFVKNKLTIYNILFDIVQGAGSVIALDALMGDASIDFLRRCQRDFVYAQNTYQKHGDKRYFIVRNKNDIIDVVTTMLHADIHTRLYIPTNSKEFGDSLAEFLRTKYEGRLRIGVYTKDTMRIEDYNDITTQWRTMDIVICSPTIVAGISFTDSHFHATVGYFTGMSSSPEYAFQQLFRVRNLMTNTMYICVEKSYRCPFGISSCNIEQFQRHMIDRDNAHINDLPLQYKGITETIRTLPLTSGRSAIDTNHNFFQTASFVFHQINEGALDYLKRILVYLTEHGLTFAGYWVNPKSEKERKTNVQAMDTAKATNCNAKMAAIANATPLTPDQYKSLCNSTKTLSRVIQRGGILTLARRVLTDEQQNQIDRFRLKRLYNVSDADITSDFVSAYLGKDNIHHNRRHVIHLITHTYNSDEYTKQLELSSKILIEHYRRKLTSEEREDSQSRLYNNANQMGQKFIYCIHLLGVAGFNHPFDERRIQPDIQGLMKYVDILNIPIEKLGGRSMLEHIFGAPCRANEVKTYMEYVNKLLMSVFGVKMKRVNKASNAPYEIIMNSPEEFTIVGNQVYLIPTGCIPDISASHQQPLPGLVVQNNEPRPEGSPVPLIGLPVEPPSSNVQMVNPDPPLDDILDIMADPRHSALGS